MAFYANLQIVSIIPKISRAFYFRICSQVLELARSIISKPIKEYRLLIAKNRDNLIKANVLLFAAIVILASFSSKSSC